MNILIYLSFFTFFAGVSGLSMAQSPPDLGPVGPKTDSSDRHEKAPPANTTVDLPYKPSPSDSPSDDDSMGWGGGEDDVDYVKPVEIVVPFITSKSPDPHGAPDPEY
jgi:hypothetical protein